MMQFPCSFLPSGEQNGQINEDFDINDNIPFKLQALCRRAEDSFPMHRTSLDNSEPPANKGENLSSAPPPPRCAQLKRRRGRAHC